MCGRYYVDDDTAEEIEKVIRLVDAKVNGKLPVMEHIHIGDVRPSEVAPVLLKRGNILTICNERWGFPGKEGKTLVINARSETVNERPMFSDSVAHRRIAIPAAGFYEWNKDKKKYTFRRKDKNLLWMAGFYNRFGEEDRFVILTTGANASMEPVHDRMPLILEEDEIIPWIMEDGSCGKILKKAPCQLNRSTEYEQLSLF